MDATQTSLKLAGAACLLALSGMALAACGGDDSGAPPTVSNPQVTCQSVEDMGYEVVEQVSVEVSDANNNLVIPGDGLEGQFDSLDIRLGDQDADGVFTWSPPMDQNETPTACFGTFTLKVTARDSAGNVTEFSEAISAGGSQQ
jgi:hypothetical protein